MGFLDKLKGLIYPGGKEDIGGGERSQTSMVVDELMYAFEESIKNLSTEGSLMFHAAYVVYVPEKYYKDIHLTFGVLTREATRKFHKRINEILHKNQSMTFEPLSDSWSFDIIGLPEDGMDIADEANPDESIVDYSELEENFVAVRSFAVPKDMFDFSTHSDDDEVVKTNRSQPNSKFNKMQRLSIGAIRGLKPSGTGYSYPIDINGREVTNKPMEKATTNKVMGTFKCADDLVNFIDNQGNKFSVLDIRLPNFFIGGASAPSMYRGKPMVKLDDPYVMSPHCEVKQENGDFFIRPIGLITQSEIVMPKDQWSRLANRNASIVINDNVELIFNKK